MILNGLSARLALLRRSRTVAMVGASNKTTRPSYFVFSYLRTHRVLEVTPINPALAEIDGIKAFPTLTAYAAERGAPDIVDVFRKPSEAAAVAREAVAVGAKAIWFQYGVIDPEAIRIADEGGLDVVVDRCIKVESARFDGGLSVGGFNSGLVTARRFRPLESEPMGRHAR
ncbi:MAG: CoA-binding protein [Candidatus Eremiobacteraeota bacterium]|nr:CoA-binding protein [Candidatus Eremiobacteraeota bacterium]MBV9646678.1 CoA-binding protein [Candidatus Eremiobacteraeota bacterium]